METAKYGIVHEICKINKRCWLARQHEGQQSRWWPTPQPSFPQGIFTNQCQGAELLRNDNKTRTLCHNQPAKNDKSLCNLGRPNIFVVPLLKLCLWFGRKSRSYSLQGSWLGKQHWLYQAFYFNLLIRVASSLHKHAQRPQEGAFLKQQEKM